MLWIMWSTSCYDHGLPANLPSQPHRSLLVLWVVHSMIRRCEQFCRFVFTKPHRIVFARKGSQPTEGSQHLLWRHSAGKHSSERRAVPERSPPEDWKRSRNIIIFIIVIIIISIIIIIIIIIIKKMKKIKKLIMKKYKKKRKKIKRG